jgi:hypothetical protein
MRTLKIDPADATTVAFEIDSGEARLIGSQGVQDVTVSYGYFLNETEGLDEETMVPELRLNGKLVVVRQTPSQVARVRAMDAKVRATIIAPVVLRFEGQLEHGTIDVQRTGGCAVTMTSGTVRVERCDGAVRLQVGSGTLLVSGLVRQQNHHLRVQTGTITLYAGDLLALVSATVDQGIIHGVYLGRLERVGLSGWHLHPASYEPGTTVECAIGSGTITLHGDVALK